MSEHDDNPRGLRSVGRRLLSVFSRSDAKKRAQRRSQARRKVRRGVVGLAETRIAVGSHARFVCLCRRTLRRLTDVLGKSGSLRRLATAGRRRGAREGGDWDTLQRLFYKANSFKTKFQTVVVENAKKVKKNAPGGEFFQNVHSTNFHKSYISGGCC